MNGVNFLVTACSISALLLGCHPFEDLEAYPFEQQQDARRDTSVDSTDPNDAPDGTVDGVLPPEDAQTDAIDPENQPPIVEILNEGGDIPPVRTPLSLSAFAEDPEGLPLALSWRLADRFDGFFEPDDAIPTQWTPPFELGATVTVELEACEIRQDEEPALCATDSVEFRISMESGEGLYVSSSRGSADSECSIDLPCDTIASALGRVRVGGGSAEQPNVTVIHIETGVYDEASLGLTIEGQAVILLGGLDESWNPSDNATVFNNTIKFFNNQELGYVLQNFDIRPREGGPPESIYMGQTNVAIYNSRLGIGLGGTGSGVIAVDSTALLSNNTITFSSGQPSGLAIGLQAQNSTVYVDRLDVTLNPDNGQGPSVRGLSIENGSTLLAGGLLLESTPQTLSGVETYATGEGLHVRNSDVGLTESEIRLGGYHTLTGISGGTNDGSERSIAVQNSNILMGDSPEGSVGHNNSGIEVNNTGLVVRDSEVAAGATGTGAATGESRGIWASGSDVVVENSRVSGGALTGSEGSTGFYSTGFSAVVFEEISIILNESTFEGGNVPAPDNFTLGETSNRSVGVDVQGSANLVMAGNTVLARSGILGVGVRLGAPQSAQLFGNSVNAESDNVSCNATFACVGVLISRESSQSNAPAPQPREELFYSCCDPTYFNAVLLSNVVFGGVAPRASAVVLGQLGQVGLTTVPTCMDNNTLVSGLCTSSNLIEGLVAPCTGVVSAARELMVHNNVVVGGAGPSTTAIFANHGTLSNNLLLTTSVLNGTEQPSSFSRGVKSTGLGGRTLHLNNNIIQTQASEDEAVLEVVTSSLGDVMRNYLVTPSAGAALMEACADATGLSCTWINTLESLNEIVLERNEESLRNIGGELSGCILLNSELQVTPLEDGSCVDNGVESNAECDVCRTPLIGRNLVPRVSELTTATDTSCTPESVPELNGDDQPDIGPVEL